MELNGFSNISANDFSISFLSQKNDEPSKFQPFEEKFLFVTIAFRFINFIVAPF